MSAAPHFAFGDVTLHPHPSLAALRELWRVLIDLATNERLRVRVAVDPLRYLEGPPETRLIEDYWWGVKVTREDLDSLEPKALGRAFHKRRPGSVSLLHERIHPMIGTEFAWSRREQVKTLEVEEVTPALGGEWVYNRYLHSERDTRRAAFTHLDGALKGHRAHLYRPTEEDPTARRGKAAVYRKLFRVDPEPGEAIPDDVWGEVVGLFFRHNELIAEYFGEIIGDPGP